MPTVYRHSHMIRRLVATFLALVATSASAFADSAIRFENVTATALDVQAQSDYRFDAVWTDFNGDGCPDPFIFGHADPATSRLWLNRCDGNGGFALADNQDVRYYINPPELPLGAGWMSVFDIDGDGREDFWLRHANMLAGRYLNGTPAGQFVPRFASKADACNNACVFGDIDGDGRLDIIEPDRRITDMVSGRELYPATRRKGEAIIFDVDGDGWPEVVQPGAGGYWQNRRGKLSWVDAGLAGEQPILAADLDGSGRLSLLTLTDTTDSRRGRIHLFRNDGEGRFSDITADSGLADLPVIAWHTGYGNGIAADLDNDGRLDLMLSAFDRREAVLLMRNLGGLRFERLTTAFGAAGQGAEGSVARGDLADYDFDGRLDLVKTQAGSNIGLWRNVTAKDNHWMQVRVRGGAHNSDAVGADVRWLSRDDGALVAHDVVQIGDRHPRRVLHGGLGRHQRVDLEVRYPHGGKSWRFDDLAADQAVIVFPDGCLLTGWRPGKGWPRQAPQKCDQRGERPTSSRAAASASNWPAQLMPLLATMFAATAADNDQQRIELVRNGASGDQVAVTFGIPFAPGVLTDSERLRILDSTGNEIPAHVTPTLRWHSKDDSVRAVKVQLRTALRGERSGLRFSIGEARTLPAPEPWPFHDGLVDGSEGLRVPGVLATLDPGWLSASLIAGPQAPASRATRAYDAYFDRQFQWAGPLPANDEIAWLFDRTTTLYKQYVRTGRADLLAAAIASYRFYMSKLVRDASPASSACGGGWKFGQVNPCDVKFVYIEPILLALALSGDDSQHDDALIDKMVQQWERGGWSGIRGPYLRANQDFTERQAGLGLLAVVSAWELTGNAGYRTMIDHRIGWLLDHQRNNPDGLGDDGCWRHSWQMHEGNSYDPATDTRGCSPWMSENIIDGLWHAWVATADQRIPGMITGFGRWLENHGWISDAIFKQAGHSWRDPCSGPKGQIAWYFSSSQASPEQLIRIQDSDGWYSDSHTVQLGLAVAAARYFETDPAQAKALEARLKGVANSYAVACAASASTPRRFNWNNRGSGVVQWLQQNFPAVAE